LEIVPSLAVTVALLVRRMDRALTVKLADVDPGATVTDAGLLSRFELSDSDTATPPESAGVARVTVQVALAFDVRLVALHASVESVAGAVKPMVTLLLALLSVAETVAFWLVTIVPAVAVKVAEVEPFATLTEEGVVSKELSSESATEVPPEDAALVKVTVQVLVAPEARLAGLQASEETRTGATRLTMVLAELPLYVAVVVVFWSPLMAAVVALKLTEVAAAAAVTDAGTVRAELVSDRVTIAPPAGAALVNVIVQVLEELGPRLAGLQASEETRTEATRLTVVLAELLL
jgi:hypothetical protein